MNLWQIFPESLLSIRGIFNLGYIAIPLYLALVYGLVKYPVQRLSLALFLVLTAVASITMFTQLGPRIGLVFPPLLLLAVMLMPLGLLLFYVWKKDISGIGLWGIASLAGWCHSLSWALWLIALAGS